METLYTVTREALTREAARIEAHAAESLRAWAILGMMDKHADALRKARILRNAAEAASVYTRREILRNGGLGVKTPKALRYGHLG